MSKKTRKRSHKEAPSASSVLATKVPEWLVATAVLVFLGLTVVAVIGLLWLVSNGDIGETVGQVHFPAINVELRSP